MLFLVLAFLVLLFAVASMFFKGTILGTGFLTVLINNGVGTDVVFLRAVLGTGTPSMAFGVLHFVQTMCSSSELMFLLLVLPE